MQLMQEKVQKSISTTLPLSPSGVSAGELSHSVTTVSGGNAPSTGRSLDCSAGLPFIIMAGPPVMAGPPIIIPRPPPPTDGAGGEIGGDSRLKPASKSRPNPARLAGVNRGEKPLTDPP